MPEYNVAPLARLIEQFEKLPGIGHKSARRLAYHTIKLPSEELEEFASVLRDAYQKIKCCKICCNLTDKDTCTMCEDTHRDNSVICVVENPKDVLAIERTHEFSAIYHVLHGAISPLLGVGPEQIKIKELLARIKGDTVKEVIMATNPTVEGEATAMYISKLLKPFGIKLSRLAYGIPVGADLEYADEITLTRALEARYEI